MKTKYDARHQLKQLGWTDEELDAIGLTLLHEGEVSMPSRSWSYELVDKVSDMPWLVDQGEQPWL